MSSPPLDFSGGLTDTSRVLVTGGSGFIGTNLVASYRAAGVRVVNADIQRPRNAADADIWAPVDITRIDDVQGVVSRFRPTHVVHLAARTDLHGREVTDYPANVEGVAALLSALAEASPPVARLVVASSRMVCRIGYQPVSDFDYCPPTAYGASKVDTERLVRSAKTIPWMLVRPTSIWGPWFDVPYRDFFLSVARGRYVHPAGRRVLKSFGFVGNTTWQLHRLMTAPCEDVLGRTFYVADDPPVEVRDLADRIRAVLGKRPVRHAPLPALRTLARAGDLLEGTGRRAPLTSFRLANLLTTMVHDLTPLTAVSGTAPYGLDASVPKTVTWMREQGLIEPADTAQSSPR